MGQTDSKTVSTDIEVPEERLEEARTLAKFFEKHHLRLVDPESKEKSNWKQVGVTTTLDAIREGQKKGLYCEMEAPESEDATIINAGLNFIFENSQLNGAKRISSLDEFINDTVKPAMYPIFCCICGTNFDEDSSVDSVLSKRNESIPPQHRVITMACGDHYAHTCCALIEVHNEYCKRNLNREQQKVTRAISLPFEKLVDGKFPIDVRCSVCSWGGVFSQPELRRFMYRPTVSGTINLSPLFRRQDIPHLLKFLKYGDLIDVSGYRFSEMYIIDEDGECERVDWDTSTYGRIPWEFIKKFGLLHYKNYGNGNYSQRLGSMPLGHGIMSYDDVFDTLVSKTEVEAMQTRPAIEWLNSNDAGSVRVEYEGIESILAVLEKARLEREERRKKGGNRPQQFHFMPAKKVAGEIPQIEIPTVKSVHLIEKDGTLSSIPLIDRTILLPSWALYAKRPRYFRELAGLFQLTIKFRVDFSPCPCEFVIFSSSISNGAVEYSSRVAHVYSHRIQPLQEMIASRIAHGIWKETPGFTILDLLDKLAALPEDKAKLVRSLLGRHNNCNICGFKYQEKEFVSVPYIRPW